jgi:hypothetical protein
VTFSSFSPCGRRCRSEAEADEGFSPRFLLVERTPHPALRATFSHKGRREEGATN